MFRWLALIAFAGCLGISAYFRSRARREAPVIPRGRERPSLLIGRAIVALPLFLSVLAYLARPAWMDWSSFALPTGLRWVGAGVGLVAVPAAYWVFKTLGRNVSETVLTKEGHELVTTGPYRWVRHPLYAVGIAMFGAIGLMAANWFMLAFAAIALVAVRLVVIPVEERELVARFGDAYRRHMRVTGALLPRLRRAG